MEKSKSNLRTDRSFEVYFLVDVDDVIAYVGSGKIGRSLQHFYPLHFGHLLGLKVKRRFFFSAKAAAYAKEKEAIKKLRPYLNRMHNGWKPWNIGKTKEDDRRCRGGRPSGFVVDLKIRRAISRELKGKASKWMTGKTPWNKGLTKQDHEGLQRISESKKGDRNPSRQYPITKAQRQRISRGLRKFYQQQEIVE